LNPENITMYSPSDAPSSAFTQLRARLREIATLASASATLSWDQETMMPPEAGPLRAEQLATLAGLVHERATDPRLGGLIDRCEDDTALQRDDATRASLREIRRDWERAIRLPTELVREITETGSLAMEAWKAARAASDYAAFAPWLAKTVALARARAEHLRGDGEGELYDALLDPYEPGMTAARLEEVFGTLRAGLTPLLAAAAEAAPTDERAAWIVLPIERQQAFNREVAAAIGFRFEAGRLDSSAHPFCEGAGPGDTRLTTRYRADGWMDALSSTLHEAGHGLYEQGLPKQERWGEPLAESASLGIHESQSRLWENAVGRSRPFWRWALPRARERFGAALEGVGAEELFRAANVVRPNLIRVESDEATYNLHIMLRFDLERALLRGDLTADDLPGAWNERMRADLGLEVPDDARGALQDVHWSMGAIGYFPTYTLGNLYAAQLWEAIRRGLPELDAQIEGGEFAPLLGWLRREIHAHGRRFPAEELCRRASGGPLRPEPLLRYLEGKLLDVYGVPPEGGGAGASVAEGRGGA
jgi:carboxypeptidase Taq